LTLPSIWVLLHRVKDRSWEFRHMNTARTVCALAAGFLLAAASQAGAVSITQVSAGVPTGVVQGGGTLVANLTQTLTSSSFPAGVTITENIFSGATTGGITGLLFTYLITNDGAAGGNQSVSSSAFQFYTPAVAGSSVFADFTPGAGVAPTMVAWNGTAVDFNFGLNTLTAGKASDTLYVQTNASRFAFGPGSAGVIDGIPVSSNLFFGPVAVPAPIVGAGLPGLLAALSGLVVLARRRRAAQG
jgi:hypothetical protein